MTRGGTAITVPFSCPLAKVSSCIILTFYSRFGFNLLLRPPTSRHPPPLTLNGNGAMSFYVASAALLALAIVFRKQLSVVIKLLQSFADTFNSSYIHDE